MEKKVAKVDSLESSGFPYPAGKLYEMNAKFITAMVHAVRAGLERPPRVGIDPTPGTKRPSWYLSAPD
jgi:hypothetical protein